MIATHNQQEPKDCLSLNLNSETPIETNKQSHKNISTQLLLPSRTLIHHPKAGLNPLVDAAGYFFSILGKLKQITSYRQLEKLQKELIQEITTFQETIKNHGYTKDFILVCRYVLCTTFDDIASHTSWDNGQWDNYQLLAAFNQDIPQQNKFFSVIEHAIKEPANYIDLMELLYICLSLGYKGPYRTAEQGQTQLDQITNNLYQHIRAYRGNFSKHLSPIPLKSFKTIIKNIEPSGFSLTFILFATICAVMVIFVSLGYIMDIISDEAYKNVAPIQHTETS